MYELRSGMATMSGDEGDLTHRSGGKSGETGPVGHEAVDGRDGNHLGARLAVHVHEHGEEELDTVPPGGGDEILLQW